MYTRTEWPRLVGLGRLVCGYRGGHFIDTDNPRTETKAWVLSGMAFCNILISSQIDQKWRLAPGKRPQNAWGWPQSLKRPQNGCRSTESTPTCDYLLSYRLGLLWNFSDFTNIAVVCMSVSRPAWNVQYYRWFSRWYVVKSSQWCRKRSRWPTYKEHLGRGRGA